MSWWMVGLLACSGGSNDGEKGADPVDGKVTNDCDVLTACPEDGDICLRLENADGTQVKATCVAPLDACGGVHEEDNCMLDDACNSAWKDICEDEGAFLFACQTRTGAIVTCQQLEGGDSGR